MQDSCKADKLTLLPPRRGLSLGWRLALSTALIIALVMGGISVSQQILELGKDRNTRRELLRSSLTPLMVRLERAVSLEAMRRDVEEFHAAYASKGYPLHNLVLRDAAGNQVLSTRAARGSEDAGDDFRVDVPIISPVLEGGRGTLEVSKPSRDERAAVRHSWMLWTVHFVVTLGVVFLFLATAIYLQVTRPIDRLVRGVRKMEMGYWGPIDGGSGAWEVRWLAWRFGNMAQEVRTTMHQLFEAERKAWSLMQERTVRCAQARPQVALALHSDAAGATPSPAYRELVAVCERLESAAPDDVQAQKLAREVWRHQAVDANRFGFHQIKARLEDAALRLTEPATFVRLNQRLDEVKRSWSAWAEQQRSALLQVLEEYAIPCVSVLHRVKHTAGVWAKMRGKGLDLDEVYDLFAFRIIVSTEADCYTALGVVHRVYKPQVSRFKDYIARPKENGYRSLHTCVSTGDGPVFEVQVRSIAMDRQAERGDAAHWLYKQAVRDKNQARTGRRRWRRLWGGGTGV